MLWTFYIILVLCFFFGEGEGTRIYLFICGKQYMILSHEKFLSTPRKILISSFVVNVYSCFLGAEGIVFCCFLIGVWMKRFRNKNKRFVIIWRKGFTLIIYSVKTIGWTKIKLNYWNHVSFMELKTTKFFLFDNCFHSTRKWSLKSVLCGYYSLPVSFCFCLQLTGFEMEMVKVNTLQFTPQTKKNKRQI